MPPQLPLIRSGDLITEASASDRVDPILRSITLFCLSARAIPTRTATLDLRLALSLLVPRILANHHHATVPANHLALVADPLDARLDLHRASF